MEDGLNRKLDPGPPQVGDSYDAAVVEADVARRAGSAGCRGRSATRSPRSRPTTLVRGALPSALYDAFVAMKTDEWERFCGAVTDWHREDAPAGAPVSARPTSRTSTSPTPGFSASSAAVLEAER